MDLSGAIAEQIQNVQQYHMNLAAGIVSPLPPPAWREMLRDALYRLNNDYVAFLDARPDELPVAERHAALVHELSHPSFNPGASWLKRNVLEIVDNKAVLTELESGIGTSVQVLQKTLHNVICVYLETLHALFAADTLLSENIAELDNILRKIVEMPLHAEPSPELSALQTAALHYLEAEYGRHGIAEHYKHYCKLYARFCALRPLVTAFYAVSDARGQNVCSICTTATIGAALVPCGHVYCTACAMKQRTLCFICRTAITDRLKLYFS